MRLCQPDGENWDICYHFDALMMRKRSFPLSVKGKGQHLGTKV